jgi:cobalt-zinc-cadmium efflux system protein
MSHDHQHPAPAGDLGRAFAVGIGLNLAFVVIEAVFGVLAHSTALLADAAHNLSDVLGLVMAWGASSLARRAPSSLHTYGFRRSTVLAALANAVLLLAAVGAVAWEAIGRFRTPSAPEGATMMWVAAVGVLVNGVSALLFRKGSKTDANVRGAFLHLAADAAVSAGVVVAGAVVWRGSIPSPAWWCPAWCSWGRGVSCATPCTSRWTVCPGASTWRRFARSCSRSPVLRGCTTFTSGR